MSARTPDPLPPQEDEVPADDRIIGRAFRISLLAFLLLGLAGAGAWWWLRPAPPPPAQAPTTVAAPVVREKAVTAPDLPFKDVTAESGIAWRHVTGGTGNKWLPETMGPGCAFLDLEDDGDADLLLVNGCAWPGEPLPAGSPPARHALYRNDGRGRFTDVTAAFGLVEPFERQPHYGMAVAVGDADGDGDRDLVFTGVGGNRLFLRDGDRYVEATAGSGLAGDPVAWTTSAGFLDADRDGDLDLVACEYVRWSQDIDRSINYTLDGTHRAFGPPKNYQGGIVRLYRNEGGGRFTDVSEASGMVVRNADTGLLVAKALALVLQDLDDDGHPDVFVANDTTPNFLFHGLGGGRFEEAGARSGVAFDAQGNSTGAMGSDAADLRGDGALAIAVGNFANEMNSLYVAPRDPLRFSDASIAEGYGPPSRSALTFGLLFLDVDLDGRVDLFHTNGHLEEEIEKVQRSQRYRQPSQLFWNVGPQARACLGEVPREKTGDLATPVVGRAASMADIDLDGDLDLLITQCGDRPLLLRNDQALGHHWLAVRLVGKGGNRDGLGARVELRAAGLTQRRWISGTRSYLAQVEPEARFGLGSTRAVESLEVRWPDGSRQAVVVPGVDRVVVVRQP